MPYQTDEIDALELPATIDRRRSARNERVVPAWLSDASGRSVAASQQQVTVNDLSLHGVGFHAKKAVSRDDTHWIVIADDCLHLSTRLRIVSVRPGPDGGFQVGAEFF